MVISIAVGLIIWLVLPLLLIDKVKKKYKKVLKLICKICGITIIILSVIGYL